MISNMLRLKYLQAQTNLESNLLNTFKNLFEKVFCGAVILKRSCCIPGKTPFLEQPYFSKNATNYAFNATILFNFKQIKSREREKKISKP